ncbi:MAG: glycosyltransferase family 1 protein [Nitrospirae bacterium]|nr:glycosyltransferase family 1 protein [Nitrospirota bacterium]
MKILVIGPYKWNSLEYSTGFNSLVAGLHKTGADFDYFPDILKQRHDFTPEYIHSSGYDRISYPEYSDMVKKLRSGEYGMIITTVCYVDYNGGKHGALSKISRRLKYSLASNKYRMGGTIVSDWIHAGIKLPPVIVFDDKDNQCIWPVDFDLLENCSLYFKRELPFDRFLSLIFFFLRLEDRKKLELARKLRPVWLSYNSSAIALWTDIDDVRPYEERDIDISHLCGLYSSYSRIKILPLLDKLSETYNIATTKDGKLSKAEYFEKIKRSKISLSLEGRGWDCNRHYELMLCRTLLFVTRPSIELAFNLIDGENCVFIDNDLGNFEKLAKYYLDNPLLSARIAHNGYELAKNRLGSEKLAEYVINASMGSIK